MKETINTFSDMAEDGQRVIAKIETSNDNILN